MRGCTYQLKYIETEPSTYNCDLPSVVVYLGSHWGRCAMHWSIDKEAKK